MYIYKTMLKSVGVERQNSYEKLTALDMGKIFNLTGQMRYRKYI